MKLSGLLKSLRVSNYLTAASLILPLIGALVLVAAAQAEPVSRMDWALFDQQTEFPNVFALSYNGLAREERDRLVTSAITSVIERVQLPVSYTANQFKQGYFFRALRAKAKSIVPGAQLLLGSETISAAVSYLYKKIRQSQGQSFQAVCEQIIADQRPIAGGDFFGLAQDLSMMVKTPDPQRAQSVVEGLRPLLSLTEETYGKLGRNANNAQYYNLSGLHWSVHALTASAGHDQSKAFLFEFNNYNLESRQLELPLTSFLDGGVRFLGEQFKDDDEVVEAAELTKAVLTPLVLPWLNITNLDALAEKAQESAAHVRDLSDTNKRRAMLARSLEHINEWGAHNRLYRDPKIGFIRQYLGDTPVGRSIEVIPLQSRPPPVRKLLGSYTPLEYVARFSHGADTVPKFTLYHASRKTQNLVRIRRTGFKPSTAGDLRDAFSMGVGVYADLTYYSVNRGEYKGEGLVFPLHVKMTNAVTILNWDQFKGDPRRGLPGDPDFARILAEANEKHLDIFTHLARSYGVDIISGTSIRSGATEHVVLNAEAVENLDELDMLKLEMTTAGGFIPKDLYSLEAVSRYIQLMQSMGYDRPEYAKIRLHLNEMAEEYRVNKRKLNGDFHVELLLEALPTLTMPDTVNIIATSLASDYSKAREAAVKTILEGRFSPDVTSSLLHILKTHLINKSFWADITLLSIVKKLWEHESAEYVHAAREILQAVPQTPDAFAALRNTLKNTYFGNSETLAHSAEFVAKALAMTANSCNGQLEALAKDFAERKY